MRHKELYDDAVACLCDLIRIPSFSCQESGTADMLAAWLSDKLSADVPAADRPLVAAGVSRKGNNVWVGNLHYSPDKPTILLCSHHDTVRPGDAWTRDPFDPVIENGPATSSGDTVPGGARLYGLGSNDAGASVVSLAAAFRHFHARPDLKYNLILALVAEEEISGPGGVRSILPELGLGSNPDDFALVGEPTDMRLAIAEKGLMVLDCVARGRAGHAARDEGDNAIYRAMRDIEWFRTYRFPRKSPLFGEVKMSVTLVEAGSQHNVVPAECRFTVDCRVTECYTNEQVLDTVRRHVASTVTPRSLHLRSSSISPDHPIVRAGVSLGMSTFGSPTTSDQVALTMIPSVKIGPGRSERSHSADEYVELAEIGGGIESYIELLEKINSMAI